MSRRISLKKTHSRFSKWHSYKREWKPWLEKSLPERRIHFPSGWKSEIETLLLLFLCLSLFSRQTEKLFCSPRTRFLKDQRTKGKCYWGNHILTRKESRFFKEFPWNEKTVERERWRMIETHTVLKNKWNQDGSATLIRKKLKTVGWRELKRRKWCVQRPLVRAEISDWLLKTLIGKTTVRAVKDAPSKRLPCVMRLLLKKFIFQIVMWQGAISPSTASRPPEVTKCKSRTACIFWVSIQFQSESPSCVVSSNLTLYCYKEILGYNFLYSREVRKVIQLFTGRGRLALNYI